MSDTAARPVRVLHVLEAARGGTTRHLVDVVRHARGVEHHVAVPPRHSAAQSGALYDEAGVAAIEANGAQLHEIAMRRSAGHPANLAALVRLRQLIGRVDPMVVHGHSSVGGALGRMAAASTGRPAVYTPNGIAVGLGAGLIERALGPLTARLIAVSESEADAARSGRLARPERVVVIPNGIDLAPPEPPAEKLRGVLGLEPDVALVGTVARLVPQKAPEQFVAIAAAVARRRPDAHFVLIGMGPLQDALDEAVRMARLGDRWHQIPYLAGAAGVLNELDVFVLASRFEGGPYTPLEAMRAGTPVVLTDVVGNHDAVEPGVSGVLAPFGDSAALADGVLELLDDPLRRHAMVAAARQHLVARFDAKSMGAKLAGLYAELSADAEVSGGRRRTRRLPHPHSTSSAHSPDATASQ